MINYDASKPDGLPVHCIVCGKLIPDAQWFGRVNLGKYRVALCCPRCTEKYAPDPRAYNWRVEAREQPRSVAEPLAETPVVPLGGRVPVLQPV